MVSVLVKSILRGMNAFLSADLGDRTTTNVTHVISFKEQKFICKSLSWPNKDDFTEECKEGKGLFGI